MIRFEQNRHLLFLLCKSVERLSSTLGSTCDTKCFYWQISVFGSIYIRYSGCCKVSTVVYKLCFFGITNYEVKLFFNISLYLQVIDACSQNMIGTSSCVLHLLSKCHLPEAFLTIVYGFMFSTNRIFLFIDFWNQIA